MGSVVMAPRYETEVAQVEAELAGFIDILRSENVRSYLEVGSKFGGSLWRAAKSLPLGSRIVAVDMPHGTKEWKNSSVSLADCISDLKRDGYDAHLIWGDSTTLATISAIDKLAPFDAVLIDANHTMPFVTEDWKNYAPLARIVAFHDIAWRRAPEWVGIRIDVPQFWDGIKNGYRHEEIKLCPTGKNNGIGVLWRS